MPLAPQPLGGWVKREDRTYLGAGTRVSRVSSSKGGGEATKDQPVWREEGNEQELVHSFERGTGFHEPWPQCGGVGGKEEAREGGKDMDRVKEGRYLELLSLVGGLSTRQTNLKYLLL